MVYDRVHSEDVKIRKSKYGLVLFQKLDKEQTLHECHESLSYQEKILLATCLFQLLQELKEQKKIYCSIRPINIYKNGGKFVIINAEYLRNQGTRNNMDSFLLETIQNNWQYWPSQFTDPYSNEPFDFALDVYAVGCILYELETGKYPFETKLKAANNRYTKLQNNGILSKIVQSCIGSSGSKRRNLNFKQIIGKLKDKTNEMKNNNQSEELSLFQKGFRKGGSNGILDNLSIVFSKMMNDSEGWFLNYVEDDDKAPNQKYVDNILTKIYKNEEKADKVSSIVQRFVVNNPSKVKSIKKTLLLMGQLIRKGPEVALTSMIPNIKTIHAKFKQNHEIQMLSSLLVKKTEVNEKLKGIMSGNFYLWEISNFKKVSIQEISFMVAYLQQLIIYTKQPQMDNTDLSQYLVNFVCDQIYDIISTIIMCVISLRKDNELQLRHDKLSELQPIQKNLNICLRNLSQISNFISAHAIYSLEGEYIPYQEEIMLKSNPYYSTLEYFYYHSRIYKGLSVPNDYSNAFNSNSKEQKKTTVSASKSPKSNLSFNGKNYFKEEINSDDEEDFKPDSSQKIPQCNGVTGTQKDHKPIPSKQLQQKKQLSFDLKHLKASLDEQLFIKVTDNTKKTNKNENTISFEQFTNIHKNNKQISPPKKFDQFLYFNEIKKDHHHKPPLPNKKQITKSDVGKNKQGNKQINKNFVQFDQIFNQCVNPKNTQLTSSEIKSPSQIKNNAVNFDAFNPFMHQINKQKVVSFEIKNPLLTKILQGLKLKELKDLIQRNEKIVIEFNELKLIKPIGSGSAGQVFFGKYKDEEVAIKKVKAKENPNALKEFERELVTYIKIKSNPNLVSLTGISESNGAFYLITEYCSGGSLFDFLHKRKLQIALTWRERLNFAMQIAQGMQFLHLMKPIIIHRDLKSLNVLVAKNSKNQWKMRIADFGLSRSPEADMMTTQLGTIHWMAPQLLQGKQYSFKVDVYSYGIVLWQILSRATPYSNLQNPMAILKYVVMDRKRPNLQMITKQCPQQLLNVMQSCWAHQPNDRPSFTQVIKLLKMINL